MKNSSNDIKDELFVYERNPQDAATPAHEHELYEIYYLIKGSRCFFVNHNFYELQAGDLMLVQKNVIHRSMNVPDAWPGQTYECYQLHLPEHFILPTLHACFEQNYYHPSENSRQKIRDLLDDMHNESTNNDVYSMPLYQVQINELLILLSRDLRKDHSSTSNRQLRKIDEIMQEATEYIHENLDENLRIGDVAKRFNLSKEYFCVEFHRSTGLHFTELLTQARIAKGARMLCTSTAPISAIAACCGFNDSNYFSAVFKKETGLTPSAYRKQFTSLSAK